ncbi:IclR family transcriptional regulator [Microbacterium sp. zg.Y909]|nr:IclR family transcriptional regulator [Microbacterium sp. zg.Y909]
MRSAAWTNAVSVLDRITAVFDAFGEYDEGLGVSELARHANLPKSTVSRIAGELVEQGMLDREGDTFYLGARLFEFGQTVAEPRKLRHFAYPVMAGLRDLTSQSVQLAVLDGTDVVFLAIARSEPAMRPHARIGGRLPAHTTAVGKAILAFSPPDVVERVIRGGLVARTAHTITDADALSRELLHIRGAGVAAEREECVIGRSCMASPVVSPGGEPFAAISVAGASADIRGDHLAAAVRAAAASLSQRAAVVGRMG